MIDGMPIQPGQGGPGGPLGPGSTQGPSQDFGTQADKLQGSTQTEGNFSIDQTGQKEATEKLPSSPLASMAQDATRIAKDSQQLQSKVGGLADDSSKLENAATKLSKRGTPTLDQVRGIEGERIRINKGLQQLRESVMKQSGIDFNSPKNGELRKLLTDVQNLQSERSKKIHDTLEPLLKQKNLSAADASKLQHVLNMQNMEITIMTKIATEFKNTINQLLQAK